MAWHRPLYLALGCVLVAVVGLVSVALGYLDGTEGDPTRPQMRKMEEALTVYASKHKGKFPEHLEDASAYFPDGRVPKDRWGNAFVYIAPTEDRSYVLMSLGADGQPGGEGEAADITSW